MSIVEIRNLKKTYGKGNTTVTALNGINLSLEKGEFVSVMGPSGCGKSTLLHLMGGLDSYDSGDIILSGKNLGGMKDDEITILRRRNIGFIFQNFNLIPVLTALDNVALPRILDGMKTADAKAAAKTWLVRLGLGDRLDHRPSELSGGQQQRVAIARALASEPALILADEPTGNLDSLMGDEVVSLLKNITSEYGRTILMVTHDSRMAAYADRIIFLKDGTVVDETRLVGAKVN
jgi:putative ABC transport system ATP-binding protein